MGLGFRVVAGLGCDGLCSGSEVRKAGVGLILLGTVGGVVAVGVGDQVVVGR